VETDKVSLDCLTLEMNVLRYFETSLTIYHSKFYDTPVDLNLQQNRCKNLRSRFLNFALGAYLCFVCAHHNLQLLS